MTEAQEAAKRAKEVKFILTQLLARIDEAEAEAEDTKWDEEKADALNKALSGVSWRCDNLVYDLRRSDNETLLTKTEQADYSEVTR